MTVRRWRGDGSLKGALRPEPDDRRALGAALRRRRAARKLMPSRGRCRGPRSRTPAGLLGALSDASPQRGCGVAVVSTRTLSDGACGVVRWPNTRAAVNVGAGC